MTVSFDLISPFDSNGEIVPSWDNLRRFEKSDRWRIFVPPPEVHLLVVAQIGHNMPPFDIMDVVKLVPQRSPLLISQWSGLRFCLTSHGRGVEELVDRWRCVSSNLRIYLRALQIFLSWLLQGLPRWKIKLTVDPPMWNGQKIYSQPP